MAHRAKFTSHARERFLTVLRATANATKAAASVNVSRRTAYDHRQADAEFAVAWGDAVEEATDALEAEARRRALEGWEEPVFYQGSECGYVRKYSDRMLELMLGGYRNRFRTKAVELSGPDGAPIATSLEVHFVKPEDAGGSDSGEA